MQTQIKIRAGHFELWAKHANRPQWFFVARRNSVQELDQLLAK